MPLVYKCARHWKPQKFSPYKWLQHQMETSRFRQLRQAYHKELLAQVLTISPQGVPSNADKDNRLSVKIAQSIAEQLSATTSSERLPGQTSGNRFEAISAQYIQAAFAELEHLRPGLWQIQQISSRNRLEIARYQQYEHLIQLHQATQSNPQLAAILGSDYTITPDIVIARQPESEARINAVKYLVDDSVALLTGLRAQNNPAPCLHASISCKWTIRSDRSQNTRSEALNLIRNRKGKLPHVVALTAEPTPSRLASIALGTGDIDCVYHFDLSELVTAIQTMELLDASDLLDILISGGRLKDIADLPLDLVL